MTRSTSQSNLIPIYTRLLSTVQILDSAKSEVEAIVDRILVNLNRYREIGSKTRIPWWFIAGLHNMECGGDFNRHLANGDPITKPTINEPIGIPAGRWEECAIAALKLKGWLEPDTVWDDPMIAVWRAERYNGWGYQMYHPSTPSPYLWGGTNHQRAGKYVSDGKWEPDAVSQQIGVIAIWLALGIKFPTTPTTQVSQIISDVGSPITKPNTMTSLDDLARESAESIGTLKIGHKTCFKDKPLPSDTPGLKLFWVDHNETEYEIIERLPDERSHYHLILRLPSGKEIEVYIYSLHVVLVLKDDKGHGSDTVEVDEPKAAIESSPKPINLADIDWSDASDRISKYFTVGEATKGEPARTPKKGSIEAKNIIRLAAELDKLREAYGKPIRVTSWYRPTAINRAVGGASQSQHINGGAADVCPVDGDIGDFQDWCEEHWYGGVGRGSRRGFVHLDLRSGGWMTGGSKGPRWNY